MRKSLIAISIAALLASPAAAQTWPTKPITLVVPYAAGGPIDVLGRFISSALSEQLGQQVVVENVGGAGGMSGSAKVAKAAPDGYTILLSGSAVLAIVPLMYKTPLYDPNTDFEHAALFSDSARVLVARKDLPVNSLADFAAYAKANQAKMQYGTAGPGSGMHICAVLLNQAIGADDVAHVPYRSAGIALTDLLGGRLDYLTDQISTALPQIQAGAVKALATLGVDRAPGLENLPTADEQGVKGLDCGAWGMLSLPKGTPAAIVERVSKASSDAIDNPAFVEKLLKVGVTVTPKDRRSPAFARKFVADELVRWTKPVKSSGVVLE